MIPAETILPLAKEGQTRGNNREDNANDERAGSPGVHDRRCAQIGRQRLRVRFVSHRFVLNSSSSVCLPAPNVCGWFGAYLCAGILISGSAGFAGAMPGLPSLSMLG